MKNLFSLFLVVFFGYSACAQSFSLNYLVNLSQNNLDYLDTFVSKKNYVFDGIKKYDKQSVVTYSYLKTSNKNASKFIAKITYDDGGEEILWQTSSQNEFQSIKESLSEEEFTLFKTKTIDETVNFYYRKEACYIIAMITKQKNLLGIETPTYRISVEFMKK